MSRRSKKLAGLQSEHAELAARDVAFAESRIPRMQRALQQGECVSAYRELVDLTRSVESARVEYQHAGKDAPIKLGTKASDLIDEFRRVCVRRPLKKA